MPFVSADLLRRLKARFKPGIKAVFVAVNELAGFPFLLSRKVLPTLERQISDERYSLQELAKALNARILRLTPRDAQELLNVNTPADWAVARQRWRTSRRENWS
jgi:CTP:molybdopterin cytidylyltransferase MocA